VSAVGVPLRNAGNGKKSRGGPRHPADLARSGAEGKGQTGFVKKTCKGLVGWGGAVWVWPITKSVSRVNLSGLVGDGARWRWTGDSGLAGVIKSCHLKPS